MVSHSTLNLMSAKDIKLEAIKLSNEQHNLPLVNQPFFFPYWLMKLRTGESFSSSSVHHSGSHSTKASTKDTTDEERKG